MKKIICLLVTCMLAGILSCKKETYNPSPPDITVYNTWAKFPGAPRSEAVAFSIKGKGYVGSGWNVLESFKDFYCYNPHTNTWSAIADFPGNARYGSFAFVLNDTAYVGLGGFNKDFWKYTAQTDTWTRLNDLTMLSSGSSCFVIDDVAYLIHGNTVSQYDPVSDSWTLKNPFPGGSYKEHAVAFTIGSKGYLGTGALADIYRGTRSAAFWEYDPATDTWTAKKSFPVALSHAVGFSINNQGYIGTGLDKERSYERFYRYDPSTDTWTFEALYPEGNINGMTGFVLGNTAYIGTGISSTGDLSASFYKFE